MKKNAANPKGEEGEQEEEDKDGEEEHAGGHVRVEDAHLPREVVLQLHMRSILLGGYKEMSSIFADQQRPRMRVQIAGGGVPGSQPMSTAVQ